MKCNASKSVTRMFNINLRWIWWNSRADS